MRFEGLERYSAGAGPLQQLDARLKLITAFAFVVIVVATPLGAATVAGDYRRDWLALWPLSSAWRAFRPASSVGAG